MGYTHSWHRPETLDTERFKEFISDCKKIMALSGTPLIDGWLGYHGEMVPGKEPRTTNNMIRFTAPDAQDIFTIKRRFNPPKWQTPDEEGRYFQCCKTIRLPYDTPIVACLLAFKNHFPETSIKSDGFPQELINGVALYHNACNPINSIKLELIRGCTHFL